MARISGVDLPKDKRVDIAICVSLRRRPQARRRDHRRGPDRSGDAREKFNRSGSQQDQHDHLDPRDQSRGRSAPRDPGECPPDDRYRILSRVPASPQSALPGPAHQDQRANAPRPSQDRRLRARGEAAAAGAQPPRPRVNKENLWQKKNYRRPNRPRPPPRQRRRIQPPGSRPPTAGAGAQEKALEKRHGGARLHPVVLQQYDRVHHR